MLSVVLDDDGAGWEDEEVLERAQGQVIDFSVAIGIPMIAPPFGSVFCLKTIKILDVFDFDF